jgi:hypothetical protein
MRGVQHRCIEANELEDVGKAHDLVQEREIPITLSPGRHAMDTMISFYLRTPTGFDVEFGANGELIDDATFVQTNPSSEAWGHRTITHGWAPTASATLMLPLPDVDASLHELERIGSHPAISAVMLNATVADPYDPTTRGSLTRPSRWFFWSANAGYPSSWDVSHDTPNCRCSSSGTPNLLARPRPQ